VTDDAIVEVDRDRRDRLATIVEPHQLVGIVELGVEIGRTVHPPNEGTDARGVARLAAVSDSSARRTRS